jgi:hypothetical protein
VGSQLVRSSSKNVGKPDASAKRRQIVKMQSPQPTPSPQARPPERDMRYHAVLEAQETDQRVGLVVGKVRYGFRNSGIVALSVEQDGTPLNRDVQDEAVSTIDGHRVRVLWKPTMA